MKAINLYFPGLCVSAIIAAAATFLSDHYGASAMLFALLLGMAVNFLSQEGRCVAGLELCAKGVLRTGVALLGMRITFGQVAELGAFTVLLVVGAVVATICFGLLGARLLGFKTAFGMLSGGATAICGASAALAISASFPDQPMRERATIFTVIGVSLLSTVCMIAYPPLVTALGLTPQQAGIFLGGTIHDVAQVVGAGYSLSTTTGDTATVVKLLRVAMLLPVIFAISMALRVRRSTGDAGAKVPMLPWFAVAFAVLVAINSTGVIPHAVQDGANSLARWCLVASIAAIGVRTRLQEIITVGIKPVLLMLAETAFLAALVLVALKWGGAMV
ncbi:YeiH family protein [Pseudoduganella sp. OTU4001]|uniref:YeiH family protein n=1 Tax=Pseudoduganella sp. OTU4001 TaxID=3043854 RepID=UPI00313C4622